MEEPKTTPPAQPGNVLYSLTPIRQTMSHNLSKANNEATHFSYSPSWLGWGTAAFILLSGGGYLGYRFQTHNESASSMLLDKVVSKQANKSQLKKTAVTDGAASKVLVQGPVNAGQVAVRALGIATVYCVTGFTVSIIGLALACGIHSKEDALVTLDNLKAWGPKTRKRVLSAMNIHESKNHKDSETELEQVATLTPEEQLERLFMKHVEAADAELPPPPPES